MRLRPEDLRRTLQRSATRERDYDVVSTREGYDRWAAVYDEMDNSVICVEHVSEHEVDPELRARSPRADRYAGWPLLLLMRLRKGG